MRAAATRLEQAPFAFKGGHAKVGNLDVLLRVEQEVLGLEVAVADVEAVTVVDARNDLLEVVARFVGVEALSPDEVVEEFAAFDIFHDEVPAGPGYKLGRFHGLSSAVGNVQLGTGLPHVEQAEHIRMLDQLHDDNLALNPEEHLIHGRLSAQTISHRVVSLLRARAHLVGPVLILLARLGNDLDGGVLARHFMLGEFDASYIIRTQISQSTNGGQHTHTHKQRTG